MSASPQHHPDIIADILPASWRADYAKWLHNNEEHLFDFKYWHFFDIGSDLAKAVVKPFTAFLEGAAKTHPERWAETAGHLLPILKPLVRVVPVVGVLGEGMHVLTPWKNAYADWMEGRLSDERFALLSSIYVAYTASGVGGIFTAAAKEGLTNLVQHYHVVDERYIPHSLFRELHHAGWIKGDENADLIDLVEHAVSPTISQAHLSALLPPITPHPRDPDCPCNRCRSH